MIVEGCKGQNGTAVAGEDKMHHMIADVAGQRTDHIRAAVPCCVIASIFTLPPNAPLVRAAAPFHYLMTTICLRREASIAW